MTFSYIYTYTNIYKKYKIQFDYGHPPTTVSFPDFLSHSSHVFFFKLKSSFYIWDKYVIFDFLSLAYFA
jgi:hypothetical protein